MYKDKERRRDYNDRSPRGRSRSRDGVRDRDRNDGKSRDGARGRSRDSVRDRDNVSTARRRSKSRSGSRGNRNSRDLISKSYCYTDTIVPQRDSRDSRDNRDSRENRHNTPFPEDPARIYVGNLGAGTTEFDVRAKFEVIGQIDSMFSNGLNVDKDYVFIKFASTESAARAIYTMNGVELKGLPLKVQRAYSRKGGDYFKDSPFNKSSYSPTTQYSNGGDRSINAGNSYGNVSGSGYHREREARFNKDTTESRSRSRSRDKQLYNLSHHHQHQHPRDDSRGRASDNSVSTNDSSAAVNDNHRAQFNDKKRSRSRTRSPSCRRFSLERDTVKPRLSAASAIVDTITTAATIDNQEQQPQQNGHPNDKVYSISPPLTPRADRSHSFIEQYDLGYKTQCQNYYLEHSEIIKKLVDDQAQNQVQFTLLKQELSEQSQTICKLEKIVNSNVNVNNNNNDQDVGVTQKLSPTLSSSPKETTAVEKEVEKVKVEKDNTDPTTSTTTTKKEVIVEEMDIYSEF